MWKLKFLQEQKTIIVEEEAMKIRSGFVSNSSSTSFCIYGICLNKNEIEKFKPDGVDSYDWQDQFELELSKIGLDSHTGDPNWDDSLYIGKGWTSMGEDQTKRQFKEDIENKIKQKFGDEVKFGTFERSWYDG
jgi:hypothetical protein